MLDELAARRRSQAADDDVRRAKRSAVVDPVHRQPVEVGLALAALAVLDEAGDLESGVGREVGDLRREQRCPEHEQR